MKTPLVMVSCLAVATLVLLIALRLRHGGVDRADQEPVQTKHIVTAMVKSSVAVVLPEPIKESWKSA
jgi:hypothetical protein